MTKDKSLTLKKTAVAKSLNRKIPWLMTPDTKSPINENSGLHKRAQAILLKRGIKIRYRKGDYVVNERGDLVRIESMDSKGFSMEQQWGGEWHHYGTEEWKNVGEFEYIKIENPDTYEADILKSIAEGKEFEEPKGEESKETGLAVIDKGILKTQEEIMARHEEKYKLMMRVLENKRNELMNIAHAWEKKLRRIRKVIGQIELYLGINEDIIQMQEGRPAEPKEMLQLRQQKLYMDEEYGSWEDGGLDIRSVEQFDDWVVKDGNYKRLIPEEKGIVIMQVRREKKQYCDDAFENFMLNIGNDYTYFLIRNGENVYRIFAEYNMGDRMFPQKTELENYIRAINGERIEEDHFLDDDKAKDALTDYQQTFLIIQGLIDRTQIFHPMPVRINIFNPEHHDKYIRYIYDDEIALHTGRKYFNEWQKDLNDKIVRGTRVFFAGFESCDYKTEKYHQNRHDRIPSQDVHPPEAGVYSVEYLKQMHSFYSGDQEALVCYYMPPDEVREGWNYRFHERTKQTAFYLYRTDDFMLNYDLMTLEDVDYYIKNRYERRNYLKLLKVLKQIRKARIDELKWEKGFVEMMKLEFNCSEAKVWAAINWWKHKVIWKRPLTKDDAKAVRMVKRSLAGEEDAK